LIPVEHLVEQGGGLHFFFWMIGEQSINFSLLKEKVLPGGYAVFLRSLILSGAINVLWTSVLRYDHRKCFKERLGSDFRPAKEF